VYTIFKWSINQTTNQNPVYSPSLKRHVFYAGKINSFLIWLNCSDNRLTKFREKIYFGNMSINTGKPNFFLLLLSSLHKNIFSVVIFSHHPKFHTHSYICSALIAVLSKLSHSFVKFLFTSQQNFRVFYRDGSFVNYRRCMQNVTLFLSNINFELSSCKHFWISS
jgi:hypothetical protein